MVDFMPLWVVRLREALKSQFKYLIVLAALQYGNLQQPHNFSEVHGTRFYADDTASNKGLNVLLPFVSISLSQKPLEYVVVS